MLPGACVPDCQGRVWSFTALCGQVQTTWNSEGVESHSSRQDQGSQQLPGVCVLGGHWAMSAKWVVMELGGGGVSQWSPPKPANLLCDLGPVPQPLWTLPPCV